MTSIIFNPGGFVKKSLVLIIALFALSLGAFAETTEGLPVLGKKISRFGFRLGKIKSLLSYSIKRDNMTFCTGQPSLTVESFLVKIDNVSNKWYDSITKNSSYFMVEDNFFTKVIYEFIPNFTGDKVIDIKYTTYFFKERLVNNGTFKNPQKTKTIHYYSLHDAGSCFSDSTDNKENNKQE
jgi:hypothetical protein